MGDSCLILLKNRNFYAHKINFNILPESDKIPIPLEVDQYTNFSGHPNFSEFWSYISILNTQIATGYSVFDRF